ncbi:MAG: ATP-binding cassette domain-containing protein [Microgenomates group bacterium]
MISLKNVTKDFGEIKAVDNVTFSVDKGEFVFITGPSGAGKTTVLRLILRDLLPDTGEVTFDGQNVVKLTDKEIPGLRQKIGVVFQDFKVLSERTLRENVEVALAVIGVPQEEWKARVDQVLKLVGLIERSELFPSQLSGGELQRVSLARALVVNPKVILADEPTGNLDWDTADELMDLLEKVNKEGKTVIMATHHRIIVDKHRFPPDGGKLKRKVIEMDKGRVVGQPPSKEEKVKVKVEEVEEKKK